MVARFSGCAVDSWKSRLTSFQPSDFDFTLNLFELDVACHQFGFPELRQRGGKDAGARSFPVDVVSKNLPDATGVETLSPAEHPGRQNARPANIMIIHIVIV
ncbi:MAG: hypothetical protein ABIJ53_07245 [Verrucomicrobiota bacterium]